MPLTAPSPEAVQVRLADFVLRRPRQWGACWLFGQLWDQLELRAFWRQKLGCSREKTDWEHVLEALVACAGVTLSAVATALGITLRDATVRAEGDLDFRGTLGVDKTGEAPVGFRAIRLSFDLDSSASQEQLEKLLSLTERYCVIYQTLTGGVTVSIDHSP